MTPMRHLMRQLMISVGDGDQSRGHQNGSGGRDVPNRSGRTFNFCPSRVGSRRHVKFIYLLASAGPHDRCPSNGNMGCFRPLCQVSSGLHCFNEIGIGSLHPRNITAPCAVRNHSGVVSLSTRGSRDHDSLSKEGGCSF